MVLMQLSLSGEPKAVSLKIKTKKPKKLNSKNRILQAKIKELYGLYQKLYELQNISILEQREVIIKGDIIIYPDERQAEPIENIFIKIEDIDKRIENMLKVLNDDRFRT